MKKFLCLVFLIFTVFACTNTVSAKNIKTIAESTQIFNTKKPKNYFTFRIYDEIIFVNNEKLPTGAIITGQVIKVNKPKRGKRDASIELKILSYNINNVNYQFTQPYIIIKITSYKPLFTKDKITTGTAKFIAGQLVFLGSEAVSFVKEIKNSPDGESKIKSGVKKVYDDSVLSYASKGQELCLEAGSAIKVKIPAHLVKELIKAENLKDAPEDIDDEYEESTK